MLKFAIATVLLSSTLPCISQENMPVVKETELSETYSAYLSIWNGNANLRSQNYTGALENFALATAFLENAEGSFPEVDFLIHFGQVVAYDNLGLPDQCRQALGSMFL